MNDSSAKTTKFRFLQNMLVVTGITAGCFLLGGGWRVIADYSEWHSEIFMHANGVEEYLSLANWLASGPAIGALIGAVIGCGLVFVLGRVKSGNKG